MRDVQANLSVDCSDTCKTVPLFEIYLVWELKMSL